ncbi:hypothetical protein L484_000254 [Morus notabilis]|uniref:Uncharacterized protein n=1 Tax=Morus notabilis TaxID=981085 RepID=W9SFA1_9ROSA|nr:hypothetical protein L484_000254 [Morus notabilis]
MVKWVGRVARFSAVDAFCIHASFNSLVAMVLEMHIVHRTLLGAGGVVAVAHKPYNGSGSV